MIGAISRPEEVDPEDPCQIDNPFSSETLSRDISLSCYNTPKKLVEVKERPVITQDYLLRNMKGYKPPKPKDGEEEVAPPVDAPVVREPVLPEIQTQVADMITKDGQDQFRQDQLEEMYSV